MWEYDYARCALQSQALARARAAQVLCRKFANRDRVKAQLLEDQEMSRQRARQNREDKRRRWKQKTSHSPFLVDLVAENERLDEENRARARRFGTRPFPPLVLSKKCVPKCVFSTTHYARALSRVGD